MKILAIAPTYYPHMGGAERAMYELYSRLPSLGIEVDLIVPNLNGDAYEEKIKGFRIFRVGKECKNKLCKFFSYQYNEYKKAKELIKKNNYDLIHCQYVLPNALVAYLISKKIKKPLVFSIHHFGSGMDIVSPKENPIFSNLYMKFFLKKSSKIITTGLTQTNFIKWLFGYIPKNLKSIKLGSPKISKKNKSLKKKYGYSGKKVIFSIGRLVKRKRFEEIVKIAEKLSNKNFIFLIAGKGEEYDKLKKIINTKNVKLLGFIDDKTREEMFLLSDAFLYTSEFEGSGIVYTEAMSYSTPVFAYENDAIKDIIKDENYGIVTKRNPDVMAKKILEILNDNKKIDNIVNNCHKLIKETYNWENYARKYSEEFKNVKI